MPRPDSPSIVVNCNNGNIRDNHSWVLGRLLRDHESSHEVDKSQVSIRIDIFASKPIKANPDIDIKWVIGWIVVLLQQIIAVVPWIKDGDWSIFLVTISGTLGALVSGALPQWIDEKWPNIRLQLNNQKIVSLTRGNGHRHVMVIIGSGVGWDFEALATAAGTSRQETRFICSILTVWWTLLLITVSGIKENTWFLIGVGGLGMLQNIYAAGAIRASGALNVHLRPYEPCPCIIGYRNGSSAKILDDTDSDEEAAAETLNPYDGTIKGVMEALKALETELPKAGASLLGVFFPGGLRYEGERLKLNRDKKFWKQAFRAMGNPVTAATKPQISRSTRVKDEIRSGSTTDISQIRSSSMPSSADQTVLMVNDGRPHD